jgi:3-hydroxyacyl-CoA dehydrogenase
VINDAARALEAELVARPLDVDMIWIHGYGFPLHRGGPLFYADQIGLSFVCELICDYEQTLGERWSPAPLLRRLAESGAGFYARS